MLTDNSNFNELCSSTRTIMVYTNITFDIEKLFSSLHITPVDFQLTKKKRNIDKKKLRASYGSIISLQRDNCYRGLNLRKKKKYWCEPTCRKTERRGDKEYLINTVVEEPYFIEGSGDVYGVKYYCTECKNYYTIKQLGKIQTFLNQLTIVISVENVILNIMVFKDNFKVAGCKENDDAIKATLVLWNHHIKNIPNYTPKTFRVSTQTSDILQVATGDDDNKLIGLTSQDHTQSVGVVYKQNSCINEDDPQFLFKLVMMNLDFKLDFSIDRAQLNKLMNDPKYADKVHMSEYESTSHANVNIKMLKKKSPDFYFDCLVIPKDETHAPYFIISYQN